jgi:uncharacterized integral membrane protein
MSAAPAEGPGHEELELARRRRRRLIRAGLLLVAVVAVIVFVVENSQPVQVHLWFVTRRPRLIWVVLSCLVIGMLVGYVLSAPERKAARRRRQEEKRQARGSR